MKRMIPVRLAVMLLVAGAPATGSTVASSCHLRLVHAGPNLGTLSFTVNPTHRGVSTPSLRSETSYGEVVEFQALPGGRYEAKVSSGGRELDRLRLGCDPGGYYTLIAFGLGSSNVDLPSTWRDRMKRIFGGVEARVDRGGLLQLKLLRDALGKDTESGYLRVVHAAPGVVPLSATIPTGQERTHMASELPYAGTGETRRISPGTRPVEVRFQGARLSTASTELEVRAAHLYTLIVIGSPVRADRPLEILTLSNPIRVRLSEPLWTP